MMSRALAIEWNHIIEMQRAVAETSIRTCVCFECRYSSQLLATRSVLDSGLIGHVHYGEVDYYHGIGPWYGQYRWNTKRHQGGSALLTAGCHALDALLLCMNDEVEEVDEATRRRAPARSSRRTSIRRRRRRLRASRTERGEVCAVVDCLQLTTSTRTGRQRRQHSRQTSSIRRSGRTESRGLGASCRCDARQRGTSPIIRTRRSSRRSSTRSTGTRRCAHQFADAFATHRVIAASRPVRRTRPPESALPTFCGVMRPSTRPLAYPRLRSG